MTSVRAERLAKASLDALFAPRSIAVIGASENRASVGSRAPRYLAAAGFEGPVYRINPRAEGTPGYIASLDQVAPGEVDLAVLLVSRDRTLAALEQCANHGVRAAIVGSAGFSESGASGAAVQTAIAQLAHDTGMRILGPNSLGVVHAPAANFATFASLAESSVHVSTGHVAIVSQSGAIASHLVAELAAAGIACGTWISTGNEVDVDACDALDYLATLPEITFVVLYLEGTREGAHLIESLDRARRAGKVVGVLKAGRSAAGSRAVSSHTAAIAGAQDVYDAVFDQAGALRLRDFTELIVAAQLLVRPNLRDDGGLCVLTVSGGAGALVCDEASDAGIDVTPTPADVQDQLREQMPFAIPDNPIDVTGQLANDPEQFRVVTKALAPVEEFATVLIFAGPALMEQRYGEPLARAAVDLQADSDKDVIFCGPRRSYAAELLAAGQVPYVTDPVLATRMLGRLRGARRSTTLGEAVIENPQLRAVLARRLDAGDLQGPTLDALSESTSKAILGEAGVRVPRSVVVTDESAAVAAFHAFGGPVVLKANAPGLLHKTELGLVRTDLADAATMRAALQSVQNALGTLSLANGELIVEEQIRAGVEVLLDVRLDPDFGLVVTVGHGGVFAEVEHDVAVFVGCPTQLDFLRRLEGLRLWPRLSGYRGRPEADVASLYDMVRSVSALMINGAGRIREVELNPVIVLHNGSGSVAVDATVYLTPRT
jgi:acyl-CoA synthetase (NDP forming)